MAEIITLAPHDPMPDGRAVVVLQRLMEDEPGRTTVQITLTGHPEQTTHPRRPDGTPMGLDEAIVAARTVADEEGIAAVHVLDRTSGAREKDILAHQGDHTVHMDALSDTDEEDGELGADMRDVHRSTRGSPGEDRDHMP